MNEYVCQIDAWYCICLNILQSSISITPRHLLHIIETQDGVCVCVRLDESIIHIPLYLWKQINSINISKWNCIFKGLILFCCFGFALRYVTSSDCYHLIWSEWKQTRFTRMRLCSETCNKSSTNTKKIRKNSPGIHAIAWLSNHHFVYSKNGKLFGPNSKQFTIESIRSICGAIVSLCFGGYKINLYKSKMAKMTEFSSWKS